MSESNSNSSGGGFQPDAVVEHLIAHHQVPLAAVDAARKSAEITGKPVALELADNQFVTLGTVLEAVAVTFSSADPYAVAGLWPSISPELLVQNQTVVLGETDEVVYVATSHNPKDVIRTLEHHTGGRAICVLEISEERYSALFLHVVSLMAPGPIALERGVFIEQVLGRALRERVDNVLVEPTKEGYRITFSRLEDDRGYYAHFGPTSEYEVVRDQLKAAGRIALDERRIRQRGAFTVTYSSLAFVDARVTADPGTAGEWILVALECPGPPALLDARIAA